MVKVRVTKVQYSDGSMVEIPAEGVVLLVGPNNAGKSQALKDLTKLAREPQSKGRVLTSVDYEKDATATVGEWVANHVPKIARDGVDRFQVEGWGEIPRQAIENQWNQPNLNLLTPLFVFHADGTSRLSAGDSQPNLDFSVAIPFHPVQRTYLDPAIEEEIDKESRAVFGLGIAVDRYAGSVISLRLGEPPLFQHDNGRPSKEYLAALKELPRLEDQGDGIRSYLGLILHLAAGQHQILLIDEPEAFLHPPQARRLGSVLADRARDQQVFIATHSNDVLQGALEGGAPVTIIRVTRDGNINRPAVLSDSNVKTLWSDPLLRYSNVLDGLFHDAVVLCESDADCRFYSAVLDHLSTGGDEQIVDREAQLLFTHCGGKARMSSVVDALSAVSVPVVVVADFDVLRNSTDVERIVHSLGGDFGNFEADLKLVGNTLTSDGKPLRKLTLKDELNRKLDALPTEVLSRQEVESIRALIKAESGWDKAKRAGLQAVPQGNASQACERLLAGLQQTGLCVVPVGELERFAPNVAGHGPSWVSTVLEQKIHESPGHDALEFVKAIREMAS